MKLPDDSLISHAVKKMNDRLQARESGEQNNFARGGLLFMGNVHDALPRRLLLDDRAQESAKGRALPAAEGIHR